MSDNAQSSNQQMIVIALVVIAVLLAAIVGVLIWQQSQSLPAPTASGAAQSNAAAAAAGGSNAQVPANMQAQAAAPTAFDANTATKVPAGMTPQQLVKTYNEDVIAGKFADAYKLLPIDKQKSYGDPNSYASQLKAYGITSYKMASPTGSGNDMSIAAEQVTPQMPITYTWTFKKVGSQWYVASRTMGGTVQ